MSLKKRIVLEDTPPRSPAEEDFADLLIALVAASCVAVLGSLLVIFDHRRQATISDE